MQRIVITFHVERFASGVGLGGGAGAAFHVERRLLRRSYASTSSWVAASS